MAGVYTGFVNYSGPSDIPSNYIELSTNDINKVIGTDYENRVYFYLPDNYEEYVGDITIGNLNIHKDYEDSSWCINIGNDYYYFDWNHYYYYDYTNGSIISSFNNANDTATVYVKPKSNGYSITFEENGGNTQTDLTEQTTLPSPLPTTTKANHVFAGWYYDNLFTQKATPGDELTTNVTLYAKWYTPTTWCEDIADAIREKEGTTEPIKHLDFPERILAIDSGIDVSDANPFVAATNETMATYLFAKYDGSIVKFTGTTGTYTNNTLYQVYAVNQSNYAFRELQQMLHDNMPIGSNDTFDVKNYKTVTVAVPSEGLKGAISKASFPSFEEVPQNPTGISDSIIVVNDEIYILKEE